MPFVLSTAFRLWLLPKAKKQKPYPLTFVYNLFAKIFADSKI